ncbi:MAG: ATP-binding protein [Simplicispira sp.]|jgi:two-component system sensor histidine kinase QseC|uniref:ATP-binding protein n=1 Tax=Simplicispira sp. TaxID=2015802 RepID=UPI001B743549|nr:ATP-binding protein [Simplicispira sp.]MBP7412551.1 sensor histidine kinase N-terminal domain-containing protein [Giesbergeria sp.]MDD2691691.1 ATP-binding protein [Simplicispira sp.]
MSAASDTGAGHHTASPARTPRSLQTRLLVTVLALVLLAWCAAAALAWYETEHEVSELLDAHLAQTAALLRLQPLDELDEDKLNEAPELYKYQPKVVFQLWHDGQLLARSANAPLQPLTDRRKRGFTNSEVEDQEWRVFVTPGRKGDVRILVGERQSMRDEIVMASVSSMWEPMAWALPLLALGIWWAVRGSVRPLRQLGQAVATRQPQSLAPLDTAGVPPEVLPLVTALNGLFERMAQLLASEQQFTADAAHELRTPIAGIRMQAQVAQGASEAAERSDALAATVRGCDRATRLVEQLLQLARLDAEAAQPSAPPTDLTDVARTVVADLASTAQARGQQVALQCTGPAPVPLAEPLAQVLLRNLLDNALRYSPEGAQVQVQISPAAPGKGAQLCVQDSGPGLAEADMARLGERFFRVLGTGQSGSGLGWSIVQRIARLHGLRVAHDRSPTLGGLRVTITWP